MIENWDQIAKEIAAADRRKEGRVHLAFQIAVSTLNRDGNLITERTKTLDVSEFGCRIPTTMPLERGDIVKVSLISPDKKNSNPEMPAQFEVMWTAEERNTRIVGIRQIDGNSLWDVSFPTRPSHKPRE